MVATFAPPHIFDCSVAQLAVINQVLILAWYHVIHLSRPSFVLVPRYVVSGLCAVVVPNV